MSSNTLRFVEREDRYSVYTDADGNYVYIQHGTGRRLVEFLSDLDVNKLWDEWISPHPTYMVRSDVDAFRDSLRDQLVNDHEVDTIDKCGDCHTWLEEDELIGTGHEDSVCESCIHEYFFCESCEEYYHSDYMESTLEDTVVCESCRDNHYTYCEYCDGYRSDDSYGHDHDEDGGCDCESPNQRFAIRNDGEAPLENDTRTTVTLPGGIISDEGIGQIAQLMRELARTTQLDATLDSDVRYKAYNGYYKLSYAIQDTLGNEWQTKRGNYTKRLSRFAHVEYGLKLDQSTISKVGNIAREQSTPIDFAIETTRDLNLPAEEFAHEDSCWWQSYYESRCTLKSHGGFGLRTFVERKSYYGDTMVSSVEGRAWVMPLKLDADGNLTPTFNSETPAAFIVFNGYGDLSGYAPARIMSHMAGMTYRKIGFYFSPMYVNGDSGYLVAPEEIVSKYADQSLNLGYANTHSDLYHKEEAAKQLVTV